MSGSTAAAGQPQAVISVWGRFHAFDLARELQKQDALAMLITSYPRFVPEQFGVAGSRVRSRVMGELLARAGRRLPRLGRAFAADRRAKKVFERAAARVVRRSDGDVFVGWSGSSLKPMREAKARGMVTVLERCSTHIVDQTKILLDEYATFGLAFTDTPGETIEQELREYDETDYIAVPSTFVQDTFLARGFPPERLLLTPFGADVAAFRPEPVPHRPFRIIQVGGVSIRKGFRYVAEAFRIAAIPDAELWFVGGVSNEARRYFADHPDQRITLHGHVPQSRLPEFYNQCDVACLGSVEEGMAYVLIQGAACGLPLVCTENTGGREIVGQDECGVVVPPRDPQALAAAFRRMHADAELRLELGRRARARAQTEFSWGAYAGRALTHYRRITGKGLMSEAAAGR